MNIIVWLHSFEWSHIVLLGKLFKRCGMKKGKKRIGTIIMTIVLVLNLSNVIAFAESGSSKMSTDECPLSKTAEEPDENYISDVGLAVGGNAKAPDTDVVFVLGGSVAANSDFVSSMSTAIKPLLKSGAKVKVGIVVFADKPHDIAVDLNSEEAVLTLENIDGKMMEFLKRAEQPEGATNLESALIKGRDMLKKDTSVDAENKHIFVISTGLTHFFSDENGYDATIAIQDDDGDYIYGNRAWQKYRNAFTHNTVAIESGKTTSATMYPVPGYYNDNWDAYWADIEKWIEADGDKYVYSIGNQTYAEWYAKNNTENKVGSDRRGLKIETPVAVSGVPNFDLGINPGTEGSEAAHALNYERAQYEAWVVYNEMKSSIGESFKTVLSEEPVEGLGYNCYAIGSMGEYWRNGAESLVNPATQYWKFDTETQIGHSFMNMLEGSSVPMYSSALGEASFDLVTKKFNYTVAQGTTVKDYMGYGEDYNFDFVDDAESIKLEVGNKKFETAKTEAAPEATSSYSFTAPGAECATFTLDYYKGNGLDEEHFVWTFGQKIYANIEEAKLFYKVELVERNHSPGIHEAETNKRATLYRVDGNGEQDEPKDFEKPVVTYAGDSVPSGNISEENKTGDDENDNSYIVNDPRTGDGFPIAAVLFIMAASLAGMVLMKISKNRKKSRM